MHLLIVTATEAEIKPLIDKQDKLAHVQLDFLVTGVGMVATTFALTKRLMIKQYDLVVNAGIAGAFNKEIGLGEVVEIMEDRIYELGVEDHDLFIPAEQVGLLKANEVVLNTNHKLDLHLRKCSAITVNKVHGNQASINNVVAKVNPDTESMEGAAVFYVCDMLGVPVAQIRSISNYVEPRDKSKWKIQEAILNLNVNLEQMINQL